MSRRQSPLSVNRRQCLQAAAGAVGALALPGVVRAAEPQVEKALPSRATFVIHW